MKKGLISIATSVVVIAVILGLIVPVQAQTYTVWGQVFDTDGITPVDGVTVTVTDLDTTDSLQYVTAGGGYYQTVFGPPATNATNIGDTLQIVATFGALANTTTVTATGSPQQVNLILTAAPDTTAPTVTPVSPANGATNVPVTTTISATFSEAMNQASAETAFSVDGVAGTFSWVGNTMTFTPTANLASDTTYTVTIGTGAQDLAGNPMASAYTWSFVTVDITPPTITSVLPADGATDVLVSTTISATFSEAMNTALAEAAFSTTPAAVGTTFSWSTDGKTMTFTPSANLAFNTTYTVIISTGAQDLAGNPMASVYIWSFTTRLPSSLTSITVSPLTATVNVGGTQQFTATAKNQYGSVMTGTIIVWNSSNTAVGTIDTNGLFTAKAAGTTTVKAENVTTGVNGTASVTVKVSTYRPSGYTPPVPPIIDPTDGKMTSTTALTTDKATLTITAGIIVKDAAGKPLSTSITMASTPSTAKKIGAIAAYDFGPSGTTFSVPIDLVIAYDPADVPAGAELVIKMYDGTKWIDLPTTVDTAAHTATAKVSHFSIFALFAAVKLTATPTVTATPTIPTVTPTPTLTPTPPVEPPAKPWGLIIGIIVAVIIVGAAAYYFYTKKKA